MSDMIPKRIAETVNGENLMRKLNEQHAQIDVVQAAMLYDEAMREWDFAATGNAFIRFMDWIEENFPALLKAAMHGTGI